MKIFVSEISKIRIDILKTWEQEKQRRIKEVGKIGEMLKQIRMDTIKRITRN